MALKLLLVLALFAVCGIVQAQQDPFCSVYCNQNTPEGSSTRSVVRGKKHRASRSKGHLAPSSRQGGSFDELCSMYCGTGNQPGQLARGISSRQSQSFPASIVSTAMQIPEEAMNSAFGGSGGSGSSSSLFGFPNPFNVFSQGSGSSDSGQGSSGSGSGSSDGGSGSSVGGIFGIPGEMANSAFGGSGSSSLPFGIPNPLSAFSTGGRGSSDSGSGSSGSGSGSSGSGSGSSGGGSGSSGSGSGSSGDGSGSSLGGIFEIPGQMANGIFGQSGSSQLPFGIPNPMNIFSQGQSSGSGSGSSGSGSGSSGSEPGSSGSGSGASGPFAIPEEFAESIFGGRGTGQSGSQGSQTEGNLASYCQEACNFAVPSSRARRPEASGRKGASRGHKERHGRRSALPQHTAVRHTRQAGSSSSNICPTICQNLGSFIPGFGSSSQGSSSGSASSGSSAGSTGESGTSSQSSSDSQGGSATGSEESSTTA